MAKYVAESERLWLQLFSIEEHLDDCHALLSNEEAMTWSTKPPTASLEETRLRMTPSSTSGPAPEAYAVLLKSSVTMNKNGKPTMIGRIGIPRQDENVAEIGYGFHPSYWGKGYAVEAIRLLIEVYWAPGRVSKNTLTAEIDPENLASTKVIKKLGFIEGERVPEACQFWIDLRNGVTRKRDLIVWYLKRPD